VGASKQTKGHQLRKLLSSQVCATVAAAMRAAASVESHKSRSRLPGTRFAKSPSTRDVQAGAITAFEELLLSSSSALPDRPDRVDDMRRRQTIPAGEPRLPVGQPPSYGIRKKLRPCSPVDGTIDSTAASSEVFAH